MIKKLICIECPLGCEITIELENGNILAVKGNTCPRGRLYAEAEATTPKRVITSTIRADSGEMIPVKTDKPVPKDLIWEVMAKINATHCKTPIVLGEILVKNICEDANLIVTGNF